MKWLLSFYSKYPLKSISIILCVLGLVICGFWFKNGQMLAIAEEGLPFYNPTYTRDAYNFGWYKTGTGHSYSTIMSRMPFWTVIGTLSELKIPGTFLEYITYAGLVVSGLVGMFLCTYYLTRSIKTAVFSSLFYLCNLYSLSQIWSRFIILGYFVWAYLPIFFLTAIKFLDEPKPKNLFFFILLSIIYSHTYGQVAYILTLWTPVFIYSFTKIWQNRSNKSAVGGIIKQTTILILLWTLSSLWWLYPSVTIGAGGFNEFSNWKNNFDSLRGVSQYFGISQVLQLKQSYLFGKDSHLFYLYNNLWFTILPIITLLIAIYGFTKSKIKIFLGILLLIGGFISKGSNGILGYYFFKALFKFIPLTAVLRNPYEKYGLVFVFVYAILVGYGFSELYKKANTKLKISVYATLCVLVLIILPLPLLNGKMFDARANVKVPSYYQQINKELEDSDARLIQFPIIEGDAMAYDWGYIGREPSEFLFKRESISKQLRFDPYDKIYKQLVNYFSHPNFPIILGMMNVKNIVYHNDFNLQHTTIYPLTNSTIDSWSYIKKVKEIEKLTIYELDDKILMPDLYLVSSIQKVSSLPQALDQIVNKKIDISTTAFVEATDDSLNLINNSLPENQTIKRSNLSYTLKISDSKNPYILVLNNMFDNNWSASINNENLTQHFTVNGFANGWYVNKPGSYDVTIKYKIY